jgi:MoaA/NifB/PqqE/SkfB family radical SAM enzyme
MGNRRRYPSPVELARTYVRYNWLQPLARRPFLPRALLIYVTYRCNARCAMCGIWKNHEFSDAGTEMSPEEMAHVLSDPLFSGIEYLNLNGGEPALRGDLVELARLAHECLPHVKHLSLNSNGLLCGRLVSASEQILALCRTWGIRFSLIVSLHATGNLADSIVGVPGAFDQVKKTLEALQALEGDERRFFSLNCAISNVNAPHLRELLEWSQDHGLHINFVLAEVRDRFFNQDQAEQTAVSGDNKREAIRFLRHLAADRRLMNPVALRYHCLANMLEHGAERCLSCHYAMGCLILGSHGDLYYCPHSKSIGNCRHQPAHEIYYAEENLAYRRAVLLRDTCHHCPPNTFNLMEFGKDIVRFFCFWVNPERNLSRGGM